MSTVKDINPNIDPNAPVPVRPPSTLPEAAKESRGIQQLFSFGSFQEAYDAAEKIAGTTLVPGNYKNKPAEIIACWQFGLELGIPPMQALTAIAVINGRTSLYGDGFLAVIKASPTFDDCIETFDETTMTATCVMRRRGKFDVERSFSMDDAKKAGLATKEGPWQQYPKRMLQMRARGFAGRDQFADVLRGMMIYEEASDMPREREVSGETIDRRSQEPPQTRSDRVLNKLKDKPAEAAPAAKEAPKEKPQPKAEPEQKAEAQKPLAYSGPSADDLIERLKKLRGSNDERVAGVNEILDLGRELPKEENVRLQKAAGKAIRGELG